MVYLAALLLSAVVQAPDFGVIVEFRDPPIAALSKTADYDATDRAWSTTGSRGRGIVVAILDTGVDYTHPALGGAIGPIFKVIGARLSADSVRSHQGLVPLPRRP
jgi:subtilisin family serine protease